MKKALANFVDFFLPRLCPACNCTLNQTESLVCSACFNSIKIAGDELIKKEYERKFSVDNYVKDFISPFVFEKEKVLQFILHRLKYDNDYHVGKALGEITGQIIFKKLQSWKCHLLVPIPLFHSRISERGYNQSFVIARGISKSSGIPVKKNIIKRKRFTNTQTNLSLHERKLNISDAFNVVSPKDIIQKRIAIVDDVITTGATVSECAKVLIDQGALEVFAVSVAIADL